MHVLNSLRGRPVRDIVAKAAYNARTRLEFTGNCIMATSVYDWNKYSKDVLSHAILLPEHVDKEFANPEKLWNSSELFERRKDSQVGKEVLLALPDDKVISDSQRIDMAQEFAKKYFVSKGYGVQIDIHYPSQRKSYDTADEEEEINQKNFHAHILITERQFDQTGQGFCRHKTTDLIPEVRGGNHIAFGGLEWGKLWTQFQNEYFENNGLDLRVDQPGVISQIHLRTTSDAQYKCV